jgi:hypothetical protein
LGTRRLVVVPVRGQQLGFAKGLTQVPHVRIIAVWRFADRWHQLDARVRFVVTEAVLVLVLLVRFIHLTHARVGQSVLEGPEARGHLQGLP